jgi:hypothetical protein
MAKIEEYVVKGAVANCDKSQVPKFPAQLSQILDNMIYKVNGNVVATTMSLGPAFGVQPFGICTMIPKTPAVPTPPCVCVVASWSGGYTGISVGPLGGNPLTSDSKATCALGGSISFITSGQIPKPDFLALKSAAMDNFNSLSEIDQLNKIEPQLPESVDLTEAEELLSNLNPKYAKDKNLQYQVWVALFLHKNYMSENDLEKYDSQKSQDDRKAKQNDNKEEVKKYDSSIAEFFGEYRYYYKAKSTVEVFTTLISFMGAVVTKDLKVTNISRVLGEVELSNSKQIGSEWTLRNLAQDAQPGSTITFEEHISTNKRYIDAVVECGGQTTNVEYKSVKDVPPEHFTEQFSKDMVISRNNTDPTVQWKFDGDKLASEYKKSHTDAWEGNKKWSDLNDGEKEAVRADFRGKMRNGTEKPKRDGLDQVEMDESLMDDYLNNDEIFDKTFIIA